MIKKLLYTVALTAIAHTASFSQDCTIQPITVPGIYPDTTTNLPHGTAGVPYGTDIQVRVFEDTVASGVTVVVDDITINSVLGLPSGFTYTCVPANCVFPGNGNGCIWLSGNPSLLQAGTYNLTVNVTLHGTIGGFIPISQAQVVNGYRIIIDPAPAPTPNFTSADARVCATQIVTFSNTTTGAATSYNWTFPGGTPASSTSVNPVVTYLVKGSYDVTLQATNANGSNTITKPAFVLIDSLSVAVVTPAGNNTICNGSTILLSSQSTHPSFTYQWEKNNVNIPGATAATYTASQQATYRVKVTNGLGCTKRSANNTVLTSQPTAPITATGTTTFCSGGNVQLQTAGSLTNTFQWLRNNIAISGANAPIYAASSYGNYRVRITNTNGCSNTSAVIPVIVNQNPNVTITASGPLTFCAGGSVQFTVPTQANVNYQWIESGTPLTGGPTYTATTGGVYWVTAVNTTTFCVNTSSNRRVTVNCRTGNDIGENTANDFITSLHPNPATAETKLSFSLMEDANVSVEIFDITGRKVQAILQQNLIAGEHNFNINTSQLNSGLYFVSLKAGLQKQVMRLVVDHQ